MKRCTRCLEEKLPTEFHKNSALKDGLSPTCKKCRKEQNRLYYFEYMKKGLHKNKPYAEHFWERVVASEYGCWEWTGVRDKKGYGRVSFEGKYRFAHTVALILTNGISINAGELVCHRCDNPPCVRPDHLFIGTQLDNMQDAKAKGRVASGFALPHTVLSMEDRGKIISLYASGNYSQRELGVIFKVCQQRICRLIKHGY